MTLRSFQHGLHLIGPVSSGLEVVPTFVGIEEIADFTDGAPHGVDGAGSDAPQTGLELGEYEGANAMRPREPPD